MISRDITFSKETVNDETVNDETNSLLYNNTQTIVDLPSGTKVIGCKWVFIRKYNSDGSVQTFKARLVARSFIQKE